LPKKKKKTLVLTNVRKRAVGGYYIPSGSVDLKNSEPSVSGIISRIKYEYEKTSTLRYVIKVEDTLEFSLKSPFHPQTSL
jgi:hypothetical protein